ncbi:MAG: hypothetical protein AB1750_13005 [Chloroflexota bacterium]
MNVREIWTAVHGMVFGFIFLLGFSGALYAVYSMKPVWLTVEGMTRTVNNVKVYLWGLALSVWAAVFTGAWIVYPWYRATPPEGADLSAFPRFLLLANESTAQWHEFGMEWKEHVAFISPIAATVVAFIVSYYGSSLAKKVGERRAAMIFFIVAFVATAIAGIFGAFITKAAAVR